MNRFQENPEYEQILIDSAVESFPADTKAINFILNKIQKSHRGSDFNYNGDLVINSAYQMVKYIQVAEFEENNSISIFYLMTSYLHKRHINFQTTITRPLSGTNNPELTHVSPIWSGDFDERMSTKVNIADEIIKTMESYQECNSEEFVVDNVKGWKNIASKTKIMLENDIFIINNE